MTSSDFYFFTAWRATGDIKFQPDVSGSKTYIEWLQQLRTDRRRRQRKPSAAACPSAILSNFSPKDGACGRLPISAVHLARESS